MLAWGSESVSEAVLGSESELELVSVAVSAFCPDPSVVHAMNLLLSALCLLMTRPHY